MLLSGNWQLARAPLRPLGSQDPPVADDLRAIGAVNLPGNVQTQLGFTDLWVDVPELTTLNHDEWHYTRTFASPGGDGSHHLVFDGIDYFCDVWVNGVFAGHHEGAFTEWELDVTTLLRPAGEENELRLAISCPWRVDSRHFYLNPSTVFSVILKNSEYMKGNLLHYWDGLPLSGMPSSRSARGATCTSRPGMSLRCYGSQARPSRSATTGWPRSRCVASGGAGATRTRRSRSVWTWRPRPSGARRTGSTRPRR